MLAFVAPATLGCLGGLVATIVRAARAAHELDNVLTPWQLAWPIVGMALLVAGSVVLMCGFFTLQPNQAGVQLLLGRYKGTSRAEGFQWVNPFIDVRKISLRTRNFTTDTIKVNDKRGNPIDIAAVVVWRVESTAQAVFDVDDFENYVHVQSEAAVRHLASEYPYDTNEEGELSLRGSMDEVSAALTGELQERLGKAGVIVEEARLSHLAYASEIAGAMLRRQQAEAIVAARTRIVEGAVGMVEMALEHLERKNTVQLDDERKAAMVSNLLVVLCGEQAAQPVVNAGTLYH
jgi:regulator of protease activity HflC (stomatin/prohibitin superfamily)